MTLADYLRELTLPLRSLPVALYALLILLLLWLVAALARWNSWLAIGLLLGIAVALLPGLCSYLMQIAQWRAAGKRVQPPGPEMIGLKGNAWPLFLLVLPAACLWGRSVFAHDAGTAVVAVVFSVVYPAQIGVLAITHSIVEAANPRSLARLVRQAGRGYWYAALTAFALSLLPGWLTGGPRPVAAVLCAYLLFALFAASGGALYRRRLLDAVEIPESVTPGAAEQAADLLQKRESVLSHAYGFASRGNRQGALAHIDDWLQRDASPMDARAWFLEQMLDWEQPDHALFFAQSCVAALLATGEQVQAIKVVLRCRLVDERFRPRPEDLDLTIAAAKATGNEALADALRRG